ncbi:MAG: alpha/beta hydrolase, partial [Pseudomonadota bacterium]
MTPPPRERQAYIEFNLQAWKTICSPGLPYDEGFIRRKIARTYDRSFYPEGMARQFLAIFAGDSRQAALARVTAPTLVIHGADDPLLPEGHGQATAEAIPGAELLIIEGMGHDLPPTAWPVIVEAIARQAGIQTPLVHGVQRLRAEKTFMDAGSNPR